ADIGGAEGGVGDDDGEDAATLRPAQHALHGDEEQQQGEAGDDIGHDEGGRDHAGEQGAAAEAAEAHQRHGGQGPQHQGDGGGDGGDLQAQNGGIDHLRIAEQLAVPFEREAGPDGDQAVLVEREQDQADDGRIEKGEAENGGNGQEPATTQHITSPPRRP